MKLPFHSWVGALNFLVLQWFCFRIARTMLIGVHGRQRQIGWKWVGPVLPLSGWWGDYIGWP